MTYYLVDTNIIISYMNKESPKIQEYIDNPNNHFYYTETVQKEVTITEQQNKIPDVFTYINSGISENKKELIFGKLKEFLTKLKLTSNQLSKFRNDLTIIIEAGYVCYSVTPETEFTEPYLLTNNLNLYRKFIGNPVNKKILEDIINAFGCEHLIEVLKPNDVIM